MDCLLVSNFIVNWLNEYHQQSKTQGFVVGISGGIDSAVTSTLCALTNKPTILVSMPIYQSEAELKRIKEHSSWLMNQFNHVSYYEINLTDVFEKTKQTFPAFINDDLTLANTRSRLRMLTLYAFAGNKKMLVAGTGNKVEDFGIGFFTKYGDGGVDISPIADLLKSEVFELGRFLNISPSILHAPPTDGLFGDARTDEEQIGASYPELEWAMNFNGSEIELSERQKEVLKIYKRLNTINQHKMNPIPICVIPDGLKIS
jgi:NAD+ synthase